MFRSGDGGGRIAAALVSHSFAANDPTGMPAIYAGGYGIGSFECSANHDYVGGRRRRGVPEGPFRGISSLGMRMAKGSRA